MTDLLLDLDLAARRAWLAAGQVCAVTGLWLVVREALRWWRT